MTEALKIFVNEHLYMFAILVLISTASILLAMVIDLVSGVRKALENGEATTSTGFKKTCDKARKYLLPFICLVCIDLIVCIVIPYPILSGLWSCWCVFCEFTSVREKSWKKAELRKQERTMNVIIENKDDLVKLFAELLKQK